MGTQFSKKKEQSSSHGALMESNSSNDSNHKNRNFEADLSSYEAACKADPQLRSFDADLHKRASRAINSVALGLDVGTFSVDSLRDVTECLLDMNQEVVNIIFQSKKDVWKNPDLFDLVNDYFQNSLQSLDFCASLESCLKRAHYSQSIILLALQQFDKEKAVCLEGSENFVKTLDGLRNFKDAGDPFTEEFFSLFQGVYKQQVEMLEKLQAKRRKLDKKLKKVKSWKKVTNVIFVVAFVSVLICSVVAAAVTAPPVVTALAAAASVPLGTMGKWVNYVWSKCQKDLKGQRELIFTMQIGNYVVIKDLENIRVLVDKLQVEMETLMQNAEFGLREDDAVAIAVEEIRKKVDGFMKTIQELSEHSDKCSRDINRTRTIILRKIINYPSSTSTNQDNGIMLFS